MKIQLSHKFEDIISLENLLEAWREFLRGKRNKRDVQEFSSRLMDNILLLHSELRNKTYKHGKYEAFNISDPKPRNIHKAAVRDRLLHYAIYRVLYPFFDKVFIADSFSCRLGKGTHRAINRFRTFAYKVSKNNTKTCWVLKLDIRKFFASIDHEILIKILEEYIPDQDIIWLLKKVIESFYSTEPGKGLPLGNLTSQLLVNVYMNKFDQFVKHKFKAKYYVRYADDFVIVSKNGIWLESLIPRISEFLNRELKLKLHDDKIFIKTLASGVDFLGWVHFPDYRVLRTTTKRRMFKRIKEHPAPETINSYLGLLRHGNAYKLKRKIIAE
ncbi:MAG: Retron-type reverse transcriptase [Candidatus Jorgensenbacteria bacterium GW2011_GWA1_48_13]|uniref:Retron-type reverse transcriptase n=2 Tax=Candidatus Joergenseniibacteriota TaxID=1752739 RepID=A0A0G1W7U7_9BACT|nr:MAG: Retron-type reverse transcriptase [Candidatus Jorgensenbacteria bacterium GW2011_GWA1_48_13]KKU99173.1 MAG: Retron-type reverse transcriptase [Candidatus Jorgensenbacteria bacterium GW2011_GWC1_48_8]KKW14846.1 MAG: Retron-type reverse transcriptase [Candidatus Jorgensenbacteria bacterium GW2011_GWB1_50_10]